VLYNIAAVYAAPMSAKKTSELLDEFHSSSEELLKSLVQSIKKVGRYTESGNLLLNETSAAVYALMVIRSKYNELKKRK
jgi:hypothetical protein